MRALGSPRHGVSDVITGPRAQARLRGRFSYGVVLKDLEDEIVHGWIEDGDCRWRELGTTLTDNDGAATFDVDGIEEVGVYNVEMAVAGDGSRARGLLWVLGPSTRAVIFDVDGTLTSGDHELVDQLITGAVPERRSAADVVVGRYVEAGAIPIYLTARPMILGAMTREWLSTNGFPLGPSLLPHGVRRGVLAVKSYKRDALTRLRDTVEVDIVAAYGNASADICAYAGAGIAPARTFIVGDNGGDGCDGGPATMAVSDYQSHAASLERGSPAARPRPAAP